MKSLSIALKDIQLLLKDGGVWVNLVLIPVIFILIFSGGLAGLAEGESADAELITIPVVNLDPSGELATRLIEGLDEDRGLRVEMVEQGTAQSALEANELDRLLTIPAHFTSDVVAGQPTTLSLISHPKANMADTESVQLAVSSVAQDLALNRQLAASLRQLSQMRADEPTESDLFTTERIVNHAQEQWEKSQDRPLIAVTRLEPGQLGEPEPDPFTNPLQITVPGFTILFVFIAAQTTALSIYQEKKTGSFRRLLAAPMSKVTLLAGKLIPNFVTVLIQVVVIFAVAMFLLPLLGLDALTLGEDPLALILLTLLVALCSTSLGVVIAALAHSENQITGLSTVLLWGMGLVGGAFVPSFLYPEFLQSLVKIVPHSWAIDAYHALLVFGGGLNDIVMELGALLGFSVLFAAIGLWKFDFD